MKFVYPDINCVFDTCIDKINTIVIENQKLLYELITDIYNQTEGNDGKAVVSDKEVLPFNKTVELLNQFVPFELSKKNLISKVAAEFEKIAVQDDKYIRTMELLSEIERYLDELSFEVNCETIFTKVNIGTLIKSLGLEFNEEYDSLGEKLIDYFGLVQEFDRRKLFFTVNLRSFLSDEETELFIKDIISRGIALIMIESSEHKLLEDEKRLIIDKDLCEIC